MLSLNHIPTQSDYVSIFYNNTTTGTGGTSPTGSWQTWKKPINKCDYIWIFCMSGGAGGGGAGITNAGSGGGSGAITTAIFPAHVLPDTLFISVGAGGSGGGGRAAGAGFSGTTGGKSIVAIKPITTSIYTTPGNMDIICSSGTGSWTVAINGEPGQGNTPLPGLLGLATWNSVSGQSTPVSDVLPLNGTINSCGAGGAVLGGNDGYSITSIDLATFKTPTIIGGAAGGGIGSINGANGFWSWKPMYGTGGAGGGGGVDTTGGNGGNGAYGCGGGGGGLGVSPGNGGNGGRGGDGLVIIASF